MSILNTIIVDDEESAIRSLTKLLEKHTSNVHIQATAGSAQEGFEKIKELNPDMVFLDVEMPGGDGIEMLDMFDEINFEIIFTTAYAHYAIKAIKCSAIDYILKPINPAELGIAINKVLESKRKQNDTRVQNLIDSVRSEEVDYIILSNTETYQRVGMDQVMLLKADGNYTMFYLANGGQYLMSKTMKDYEGVLDKRFFRVHKSYIVNLDFIERYHKGDGGEIELHNGMRATVSRYRKQEFMKVFGKR